MERARRIKVGIGYSFGISLTSAAGVLNERIAQRIAHDLSGPNANWFVGVQWEIEDALRRLAPNKSRDFVVAPGLFQEGEISSLLAKEKIDFNTFKSVLLANTALMEAVTSISLQKNAAESFAFLNRTVSYLNRLLQDRTLFRKYSSITLAGLKKEKNGRSWVERREIPPSDHPDLEKYQAQRLNRSILESMVTIFPKAKYVGTIDVADAILTNVRLRDLDVVRVRVYGHPAHVDRCRIQTLESAWRIGFQLDPSQVDAVPCGNVNLADPENWDPNNAQEWIQSWDNWRSHEGIQNNEKPSSG